MQLLPEVQILSSLHSGVGCTTMDLSDEPPRPQREHEEQRTWGREKELLWPRTGCSPADWREEHDESYCGHWTGGFGPTKQSELVRHWGLLPVPSRAHLCSALLWGQSSSVLKPHLGRRREAGTSEVRHSRSICPDLSGRGQFRLGLISGVFDLDLQPGPWK